jgi:hypothetical protein
MKNTVPVCSNTHLVENTHTDARDFANMHGITLQTIGNAHRLTPPKCIE